MVSLNGLEPLILLLGDAHDRTVANVACVLTNLAQDETLRTEAHSKGVVTALIPPLKTRSEFHKENLRKTYTSNWRRILFPIPVCKIR